MKKNKWVVVVGSLLLLGFVGYATFAFQLANKVRADAAYDNPDVKASLAAVSRNPNDAAAHMSLAHYYIRSGSRYNPQVVQELQQVVRIEPQNREAKFMLAYKLNKVNRRDESLKLYSELAQQQDDWGKAAQKHLNKLRS